VERTALKRNPFHPFSCFDTATLAGAALGQTVLARAVQLAGFDWDSRSAHSAAYDAERTADLFCYLCNSMHEGFLRAEEKARALGWKDGAPAPLDLSEGD
jgi:ribonuclease T